MRHYNYDMTQQVADVFKPKGEMLPAEVSDEIQLVYDVMPLITDVVDQTCQDSTSAVILTTPANVDYFVYGITLSLIKNATSTSLYSAVTAFVNGKVRTLLKINSLTLTAQAETTSIMFPRAVKIDRSSNITIINTTNTATVKASASIFGYRVE